MNPKFRHLFFSPDDAAGMNDEVPGGPVLDYTDIEDEGDEGPLQYEPIQDPSGPARPEKPLQPGEMIINTLVQAQRDMQEQNRLMHAQLQQMSHAMQQLAQGANPREEVAEPTFDDRLDRYFAHVKSDDPTKVEALKATLGPAFRSMYEDIRGEFAQRDQRQAQQTQLQMRHTLERETAKVLADLNSKYGANVFDSVELYSIMAANPSASAEQAARQLEANKLREFHKAGFAVPARKNNPLPMPKVPGRGGAPRVRQTITTENMESAIDSIIDHRWNEARDNGNRR